MRHRPQEVVLGFVLITAILLTAMGVIHVTAQMELVRIATAQQNANVRAMPSTNAGIVGSLSTGQTVEVLEENPNGESVNGNSLWYRVRLSNDAEGWVWSGVVTIAEVMPTPTTTPSPTLAPNPDYEVITANNVQNLETITEWGGLGVPYLVAWSKTSDLVAVAVTGAILFYDPSDWSLIERIEDDTVNPQPTWLGAPSFEFAGDALLIPYYSGAPEYSFQLRVYSADEPQAHIISLNAPVISMAVSPDGETVTLSFTNCAIWIYDLASGQVVQEIAPGLADQYPCSILPLAYSPDGSRLATVDGDTVSFYDLTPEGYTLARDVLVVIGAGQSVFGPESILFNLDSTQLATFGAWQDTRLFDIERGTYRSVQVGRQIGRAALSPDGRFYAFGAGILWLMDTDTGEIISDLPDLSVGDFAFSPDGGQIVQVDESSGLLQVVSVPDLSVLHTIQLSIPYADADMSLDSQTLALATGYTNQYVGGHIDLYHPLDGSGAPYTTIALDADASIHEVALSPDGSQLIAAGVSQVGRESYAGFLRRYSLPDASILNEFNLGSRDFGAFINGTFSDIAWSPDGQTLATSGGVLRLYNTTTLQPFNVGNAAGSDLAYSPDGSLLAALSGNHIYLYDARGSLQRTLNLSDAPEFSDAIVTFSPDGQTLLSSINFDPNPANRIAEVTGLLERWDVQTGERLTEYRVLGQSEKSQRFLNSTYSPDGSLVVTSYWLEDVGYRTAFFETETGDMIRAITPSSLSGNSLPFTFFSADDALLMLVNSPEGLIQVLGIPREIQETGSFLFQDDFESGRLNQWDNRDSIGSVVIHGDDHVLRLYNYLSGYSVFPIRDSGDFGSDYAVEMDMRFRETRSETDLFLNFRETQNGSYYLVMDMDSNSVGLGSRRYGAYQDLGGNAAGVQVGQWFTVRVEAAGDQLRLYIDGQLLVSAQNAVHTAGGVSLTIPPGVIVEVDNMAVTRLSQSAAIETAQSTGTPVAQAPTGTPIPRTEVAVLPANANSLELMMNGYPNRAAFTSNWGERINVELDFTNNQLMGNDGRPLVPGIHYLRPQNLDPTVLNREYNINGADVEQLLLVGFITFEPSPEVGIVVYLNVPMQVVNPDGTIAERSAEPQYGRFFWTPFSLTNIRALREDGTVIPAPASFNDGPIPTGRDVNSNVFFDKFSQTISFPTAEGIVTVRDGQEVGISIIRNVEDVALDISQQNGNRTVDQIIQDMMNTDPNDDGVAFIYHVGVIAAR
ncbi:MAG: SH3 domain-containing protein [Chloroflexi bacterium]|nr:SH3 domain-containing protein [Chloroflexota bacterium]